MFKRKIKPIVFYLPENVREMFVDVEFLDEYRKASPLNEHWYQGLKLTFGIDIFVFDVKSCKFFIKGSKHPNCLDALFYDIKLNKKSKEFFKEVI